VLLFRIATQYARHEHASARRVADHGEDRLSHPFRLWTSRRLLRAEGHTTAQYCAPLVLFEAGARQKAVYGGGTCPRLQRIAGRYGLVTLSALPRPLDRGRDSVPRQRPKRRKGVVGLPVRAGARSPLGARLGPGTPARLVVGWPTSCATDCALERAGPVVIPRRLPSLRLNAKEPAMRAL
jgi:hypothetical protein